MKRRMSIYRRFVPQRWSNNKENKRKSMIRWTHLSIQSDVIREQSKEKWKHYLYWGELLLTNRKSIL